MSTVTVQTHDTMRWHSWLVWMGRIISVLPVLIILMSSRWKLTSNPWYVQEWTRIGWQVPDLPFIASLQPLGLAPGKAGKFLPLSRYHSCFAILAR